VLLGTVAAVSSNLRVTPSCAIALDELEWRTTTSGGPGGQHANRSDTRVEVTFRVDESRSLGPRQRARLLERLGPVVRATASDTRSQARNRELARERLRAKLAEGLRVRPARRPSRPTAASSEVRLEAKRRRSQRKQERRAPRIDDA
jgi:ribosome-associated protein